MQSTRKLVLSVAILLVVNLNAPIYAASFMGLGDLDGGIVLSLAWGVSADGTVVVGQGYTPGSASQAFRWTQQTGMIGLGYLPNGNSDWISSVAYGVSPDGKTIVGKSHHSTIEPEAFGWTDGAGMTGMGTLGNAKPMDSEAHAASYNASVIVGRTRTLMTHGEAFRWTPENGMVGLGFLGSDPPGSAGYSDARGVSVDGTVIVGHSTSSTGSQAFRWTAEGGMVGLGYLPGGSTSKAFGISADGKVVVGYSHVRGAGQPFRWDAQNGMVSLGTLPDGSSGGTAFAASADGSVIVGGSYTAFVWDQSHGMRNLADMLTNEFGLGSDVSGWVLQSATSISADGTVIVGTGVNPDRENEAWIAIIPEPSSVELSLLPGAMFLYVHLLTTAEAETAISQERTAADVDFPFAVAGQILRSSDSAVGNKRSDIKWRGIKRDRWTGLNIGFLSWLCRRIKGGT